MSDREEEKDRTAEPELGRPFRALIDLANKGERSNTHLRIALALVSVLGVAAVADDVRRFFEQEELKQTLSAAQETASVLQTNAVKALKAGEEAKKLLNTCEEVKRVYKVQADACESVLDMMKKQAPKKKPR